MSNSRQMITEESQMKSKKNKSVVVSFGLDRRIVAQLKKVAAATNSTPSAIARFFLEKRCITPVTK